MPERRAKNAPEAQSSLAPRFSVGEKGLYSFVSESRRDGATAASAPSISAFFAEMDGNQELAFYCRIYNSQTDAGFS